MNMHQETPDASQCEHEPRNCLTMGSCNHCLAQENEIIAMSIVGSDKEMCDFLPENRPHAMLKANKMSICYRHHLGACRGTLIAGGVAHSRAPSAG